MGPSFNEPPACNWRAGTGATGAGDGTGNFVGRTSTAGTGAAFADAGLVGDAGRAAVMAGDLTPTITLAWAAGGRETAGDCGVGAAT